MNTMQPTQATETCSLLLDELDVAIIIVGRDGIIHYANQHVCQDLGIARSGILGTHYRQIFWPEFISVYDGIAAECEEKRESACIYYWAEMNIWEQISGRTVIWDAKPCVLLTITNVSKITHTQYEKDSIAHFDNQLNLPNGNKLEEDISVLASVETVALLYFEIKRFEDVNELYGWDCGNNLLKQIRDWLLASESRRAQLYRVNNGFALLGRKVTNAETHTRAEEIRKRFEKPWVLSTGGNCVFLHFSVSIGIVYGKYIKNEMRNIVLRTIRAAEKNDDGLAVYDEDVDRKAQKALVIRDWLINDIYSNMKGFHIHYQPIVDVNSQRWTAVEALCRWTTPLGEIIPPADFIRLAEQLNLIAVLDSWVRRTAMRQCASLGLDEHDFTLDVNFSPTQRLNDTFLSDLIQSMEEADFPAARLNIEITESTKMAFDHENINGLKRLKGHGIGLSLDDFGTGYSSIENLVQISADAIKTDKVFLKGIANDSYRQYLFKMLVDLAHQLDMRLIAEGVETEEEFDLVRRYGADLVQGYLFSMPLSFAQLQNEAWRFRNGD